MLTHAEIWRAIDTLAREHELSPSGLAKRAGLDPTTFNKSKRITREGKARWPSTESISKILRATDASINEFVGYLGEDKGPGRARQLPVLGLGPAKGPGLFDGDGHPTGGGWGAMDYPVMPDPNAYALEIGGDALQPIYRDGDIIIVSPAAAVRPGDRVVAKTERGEVVVQEFLRRSDESTQLLPLGERQPELSLAAQEVVFIHRIVWSSQ